LTPGDRFASLTSRSVTGATSRQCPARLKRLETAGLVTRERVPTDARAFLISITDEGIQALESVHSTRRDILEQAVDGVEAAHLTVTAAVLSQLAQRLAVEPVIIEQVP